MRPALLGLLAVDLAVPPPAKIQDQTPADAVRSKALDLVGAAACECRPPVVWSAKGEAAADLALLVQASAAAKVTGEATMRRGGRVRLMLLPLRLTLRLPQRLTLRGLPVMIVLLRWALRYAVIVRGPRVQLRG